MSAIEPPVEIRRIRADEGLRLRDLRLHALAAAPLAFGSNLAREQAFDEATWHARAAGAAAGSDRATFIAAASGRWVGMATGIAQHPDGPDRSPMLVGMFVDAAGRGRGVGAALVERVAEWAQAIGAARLHLWVVTTNRPATSLYERCGFAATAETRPLDHTPSLREMLMVRPLVPNGAWSHPS